MTLGPNSVDRAPNPVCSLCGRPMAADQEWCLECGAARTVIAQAPDWRIPVLVIGVIVALIAGGFAYALTQLDHNAGKVIEIATAASHPTTTGPTPLASWAPGLDGYTVVLAVAKSQKQADTDGTRINATAKFKDVGVLDSGQHPEMSGPGQWEVFTGRYATYAEARAAAAQADHEGQPHAQPTLVQRPGGG